MPDINRQTDFKTAFARARRLASKVTDRLFMQIGSDCPSRQRSCAAIYSVFWIGGAPAGSKWPNQFFLPIHRAMFERILAKRDLKKENTVRFPSPHTHNTTRYSIRTKA